MDSDTYDPANPFFKYDRNKICRVCANKLLVTKTNSLNKLVSDSENVMVYQVLESISNFKFEENGTEFICQTCFIKACEAYKFQQVCNKTQIFLDQFIEHQSKLPEQLQPIEHINVEEIQMIADDEDDKAIQGKKPVKRVPCKVCNKLIRSSNMSLHHRIHTGERPFKCEQCGASFTQWGNLKVHANTHLNKGNYVCHHCALTFINFKSLREHVQIHTLDQRHKCMECEMSFISKELLQQHAISHTDEKPYVCEICQRIFTHKSSLTVHQKIHAREQLHLCVICDKSFMQLQSLKSHMQTHSKMETKCKIKEVAELSDEISSNDAFN